MIGSLLLSAPLFAESTPRHYENFSKVQFVKNYDGDTITFNIPQAPAIVGQNMVIRVRGIDTPELRPNNCAAESQKARQAKKLVYELLQGAYVINLKRTGRGKYFRMLADVEFDGRDLATILLEKNLAVPYSGGKKDTDWCQDQERSSAPSPRKRAVLPPKISGVYVWPPPPKQDPPPYEHK